MIRCKKIIGLSLATLLCTAPTHSAQMGTQFQTNQLIQAARDGDQAALQSLIAKGANVDLPDDYMWTVLMDAASNGRDNIVQFLINAGATVDQLDAYGTTALMHAAGSGHHNVVQLLINAGANKDLQDNHGMTPLMYAAEPGKNNVIRLLIDAGADFDLQDNHGKTPLMYAALNDHEQTVQTLLLRGATLPTESQWTAMLNAQNLSLSQIERAKQLINRNHDIVQRRVRTAGEYFEAERIPPDVVRLIQQIGVEGLPPERARPVPEGE